MSETEFARAERYWHETCRLTKELTTLKSKLNIAIGALEELQLGHEHAPDLPHTRAFGDTYGWCDYCSEKVSWGPWIAEQALAKIREGK